MKNSDVKHIAHLAHIPISIEEESALASAFSEILQVIVDLSTVPVTNVDPTHQVTGLTNVLREDIVTPERTFTQQQALANARKTFEGYFVVPQVLEEK